MFSVLCKQFTICPGVGIFHENRRALARYSGALKEAMSVDGNGTFVCQLHPTGFIANTLSQGVTGTVRGTWKISGAIITLKITGAKNERLLNRIISSTIVAFKEDEFILKSDRGEISSFQRVRPL